MTAKTALGRRRITRPAVGWLLAAAVYVTGVVHLALVPRTGGVTALYWHPGLYAFLTNEAAMTFVYVPLIQLPLAVLTYQRLQSAGPVGVPLPRSTRRLRLSAHPVVVGFLLLAGALGGLWLLGGAAMGIGFLDVLLGVLRWGVGWQLVFGLYLLYVPLVALGARFGEPG